MSDIETVVYAVLAFIFGSVIGSFLNVVILRTPLKQSIITEPSHCFSCGHRLAWYDMFPIFSWIFLRGRCRYCKSKISPRYMIIEAATACFYCLSFLAFRFIWDGNIWKLVFSAILFPLLIVLSAIDIDHFEIPYWCSISIAVLGGLSFLLFPDEIVWYERLIAFGIVLVLFAIMVLVGGMGGGDLQLMCGAALLLGYKVFVALFIGILFGAVYGTIKKFRDKKDERVIGHTIKGIAEKWYQNQLDREIGFVMDGHDDVIVGSISEGNPDIEWEFLEEKVWKGLPEKAELTQTLREKIKDEREGGFKIYIKGDTVEKVKYSRRMVFGPFLSLGIAAAWFVGSFILNWYMGLF